jgi:uncharacterized NAD-dependent epimerase/dehydratase family protein
MRASELPEGVAVVYCEGCFGNAYGKTAHGLVRYTQRYTVAAVVDSTLAGKDAGEHLDGQKRHMPLVADLGSAMEAIEASGRLATHFVIGLAPDGGKLDATARSAVLAAIDAGLHVDAGLHSFLNDDDELSAAAFSAGVRLRDIRRPPAREKLHFFSGKIAEVGSLVLAVLGTDSGVGKRTTAVLLAEGLKRRGLTAELVGTGQTAWLQGVRYGILLDSLVNDFVAGELEHAVWSAWDDARPDVIIVEGQGSLMHPAYPGGFEILAAARPRGVVLQHAPARAEYDGFPGYAVPAVERHIAAIEMISAARVIGITLNSEHLTAESLREAGDQLAARTSLPAVDPVHGNIDSILDVIETLRSATE